MSTSTNVPALLQRRQIVTAAVIDVVVVLVFALIGRASHKEGIAPDGVLEVAWPFLVGLVVGWLVTRAHRAPIGMWPTALGVFALTWGVGMALRSVTDAGTAGAFMIVAAGFLAVMLVGWRALATLMQRSQRSPSPR